MKLTQPSHEEEIFYQHPKQPHNIKSPSVLVPAGHLLDRFLSLQNVTCGWRARTVSNKTRAPGAGNLVLELQNHMRVQDTGGPASIAKPNATELVLRPGSTRGLDWREYSSEAESQQHW